MKQRQVLGLSLLVISILAAIVFSISLFVQPLLPATVNSGLLLAVTIFIGIIAFLASLNDVLDFFTKIFSTNGNPSKPVSFGSKSRKKGPLRLFLCHASSDKPAVIKLYSRLKADNFDPWLDKLNLLPGQNWNYEIMKAVQSCDVVIVCISNRSSNKEGYIKREISQALDIAEKQPKDTIYLIPLRLEDCEVPDRLCEWQWVNYFEENGYEDLKKALYYRAQNLKLQAPKPSKITSNPKNKVATKQKLLLILPGLAVVQSAFLGFRGEWFDQIKATFATKKLRRWVIVVAILISAIFLFWRGFQNSGGIFRIALIPSPTSTITSSPTIAGTSKPKGLLNTPTIVDTPTNKPTQIATSSPTPSSTITHSPKPKLGIGSTMISPKDNMVMMYVPEGEFQMGSPVQEDEDAYPQHTVYLKTFFIDRTEVTNSQYAKCVKAASCLAPSNKSSDTRQSYYGNSTFADYPVVYVSWDDAMKYCTWAGRRLPSEAEWEKAAGGTDGRKYPWGNQEPDCTLANSYNDLKSIQCVGDTRAVGSYPNGSSPYGVWDMTGNVWEWVNDWFDKNYYSISSASNPLGPEKGTSKVQRGGSYGDVWIALSTVTRGSHAPDFIHESVGFRCAASTDK